MKVPRGHTVQYSWRRPSSLHSVLVTANMLLSPACSSFAGELFCQLNTKLGHGILAMGGISDAVLLSPFPTKVLRPPSPIRFSIFPEVATPFLCYSHWLPLTQPTSKVSNLSPLWKREVPQCAQVFWVQRELLFSPGAREVPYCVPSNKG